MRPLFIAACSFAMLIGCASSKKTPAANSNTNDRSKSTEVKKDDGSSGKSGKMGAVTDPSIPMGPINGKWRLDHASPKMIQMKEPLSIATVIQFNTEERKVTGTTGCNKVNGFFFTSNELFNFGHLAVDKKACGSARTERALIVFLYNTGRYKVEGSKLYLFHKQDPEQYLVFAKQN